MDLMCQALRPHGVLEELGLDPETGRGGREMLLSLVVSSRRMSGGEAIRRLSVAQPLPEASRGVHDVVDGGAAPGPSATEEHPQIGPQRTGMISALLSLVALKKAHWNRGLYFIYHVGPAVSASASVSASVSASEPAFAKDVICACNLSRFIHSTTTTAPVVPSDAQPSPDTPHEGTPENVLADFSERGLTPDASDGSFANADGTIRIKHFNGGPVNWSSAHNACLVVPGLSADAVRCLIDDNFDDAGTEGQTILTGVAVLRLNKTDPLAADGCAVFCEFGFLLDSLVAFFMNQDGSGIGETAVVFSFAGYAKWNRAQLLGEYLKGSWGCVRDGGEYLTREWTRKSACEKWEEIVDGVVSVTGQSGQS
jgi:hypothetical protein